MLFGLGPLVLGRYRRLFQRFFEEDRRLARRRGTVEERIDQLIASKRSLASGVLEGGADLLLTEMKDEELLRLVTLDVNAAMKE